MLPMSLTAFSGCTQKIYLIGRKSDALDMTAEDSLMNLSNEIEEVVRKFWQCVKIRAPGRTIPARKE
jgi:hypothetical protein